MKKTEWFPFIKRVVPSEYEEWMENLAAQGWNIDKIGQFNFFGMTFEKTEPKKYRYVFDFNARPNRDYINIYEEFGWSLVGQVASCFIWRREYTDERPESFSDEESVIKRNRRVSVTLTAIASLFLLGTLALIAGIAVCVCAGRADKVPSLAIEALLVAIIAALLFLMAKRVRKAG